MHRVKIYLIFSWVRRSGRDQQNKVFWLSYAVIGMICLTTGRARFYS